MFTVNNFHVVYLALHMWSNQDSIYFQKFYNLDISNLNYMFSHLVYNSQIYLSSYLSISLHIYFCCCCLFRATPIPYGGSQARGPIRAIAAGLHHSHSNVGSEPHLWHTPQAHSNTGSLTHWTRPGIEPATSWFLVRFVSTVPRRELPDLSILSPNSFH